MTDARVFQETTDVAVTGQDTDARLARESIDVAVTGQDSEARLARESIDVAILPNGTNRSPPPKQKGNQKTDFGASLSVVATLPTGTDVDDLLVAFVVADSPPATADGWELLATLDHVNIGLSVFWRISTGTDPLTFTKGTTKTGEEVIIVTIENAEQVAPEIGTIVTGGGVDTTITASITPVSLEHLLLGAYGAETSTSTWTPPSGMTEELDSGGSEIATEYRLGSGTVNRVATASSLTDTKIAALLAISPPPDTIAPTGPTTHYFDGAAWSSPKPFMRFDGAAWAEKQRAVI